MRKRFWSAGPALILSAFLAGGPVLTADVAAAPAVPAASSGTGFEAFALGEVNGQEGWTSGHGSSTCWLYDVAVVPNTYGYASFGAKSLRISNAITCGSFNDQTFSPSLADDAGEPSASSSAFSGGMREPYFEAQWDVASAVPASEQPGLSVVASPARGDTTRMSWVQMQDTPTGLQLNFEEYRHSISDFVLTPIATDLDRTVPHTVRITISFIEGPANDVVKVYLDGALIHTGTSWEDYYRDQAGGIPHPVDSVLFRVAGTPEPATSGHGFLIDNFSSSSGPVPSATPTVSAVSPSSGSTDGGTRVTLTGTNLDGASSVLFGGLSALSFTVNSSTQISATTPPHGAGVAAVTVVTPGGTTPAAVDFTFRRSAPTLSGLSPSSGPLAGGTLVTVTGRTFTDAIAVRFDGVDATSLVVVDATHLTAITPARPAGTARVSVLGPGGSSAELISFTFVSPPTVMAISPATGDVTGDSAVAIVGANFANTVAVRFGGTPAASFTVESATRIVATTPPHAAGTVIVTVTTVNGGASAPGVSFTFVAEPGRGGDGGGPPGTGGTGPSIVPYVLPSTPTPSLIVTVTGPVQLPSDGQITAPTTITSIGGDASIVLRVGTFVRTADGRPFTGLLYPAQEILVPTGGALVVAYTATTSEPVVFSTPITIVIRGPDPGDDPNEYQAVLVRGTDLTYLPVVPSQNGVALLTDHLGTYGLVRILKTQPTRVFRSFTVSSGPRSQWAGQSYGLVLAPGQLADVAIYLLNSGTVTWRSGVAGAQVLIGSAAPLDTTRDVDSGLVVRALYNGNRYATQAEATVGVGEVGTFWFRVRAPASSGSYAIPVRPVIEGVAWLDDEGIFIDITVP